MGSSCSAKGSRQGSSTNVTLRCLSSSGKISEFQSHSTRESRPQTRIMERGCDNCSQFHDCDMSTQPAVLSSSQFWSQNPRDLAETPWQGLSRNQYLLRCPTSPLVRERNACRLAAFEEASPQGCLCMPCQWQRISGTIVCLDHLAYRPRGQESRSQRL